MKVAIVDDDEECRTELREYVQKYSAENAQSIECETWSLGLNFVSEYSSDCDAIFLDIEMPYMDGIATAKKIRQSDSGVSIIFLTNYSQYAIKGYEVNALGYVIKPITYFVFQQKLKKALLLSQRFSDKVILINMSEGAMRIPIREIVYADTERNYTVYHTISGEYRERIPIREAAEKFKGRNITACTAGCLVNLDYVNKIIRNDIYVPGDILPLSRRKKKEFTDRYIGYISGISGGK